MIKRLGLVLGLVLATCLSASAATVTLNPADLSGFALTGHTETGTAAWGGSLSGGGNYFATWTSGSGDVTATYSLLAPTTVVGATDTLAFNVVNNNGSIWNFQASINGGAFTPVVPVAVPNIGGSNTFTFLNAGPLTRVDVRVSQTIPISGFDRAAEFSLAAVPEPASMLLLGTGLAGLAFAARRRQKA